MAGLLRLRSRAARPYDNTYDNCSGNGRKALTPANAAIARIALISRAKSATSSVSCVRGVWRFFCFACKGSGVRVPSSPPIANPRKRYTFAYVLRLGSSSYSRHCSAICSFRVRRAQQIAASEPSEAQNPSHCCGTSRKARNRSAAPTGIESDGEDPG